MRNLALKNLIEKLALWMHYAGSFLVFCIMMIVVYEVIARQAFNRPFPGTSELVASAIVLLTFLQAPHIILRQKLLRVTFLIDRLGGVGRRGLDVFAYGLAAFVFLAIVAISWKPALHSFNQGEFFGSNAFRIPAWPLRFSTLVLWCVAAVACLKLAIDAARGRVDDSADSSEG